MKAEELMVGDWVFDEQMGIPVPVCSIREGREYPCRPIPITPEILEKNGFERDFEDGSLIWVDEQDVTEIVWGGTILTIHGENGHLELDNCMYVHELQRALRLCKIDKTIEL